MDIPPAHLQRLATFVLNVDGAISPKGSMSAFKVGNKAVATHTGASRASEGVVKLYARDQLNKQPELAAAVATYFNNPIEFIVQVFFDAPIWVCKRRRPGRKLRDGSQRPAYEPMMKRTPDADKLVRTVADALQGLLFRDDRQIIDTRCIKAYAPSGQGPSTRIEIGYLQDEYLPEELPNYLL